MADLIAVSIFGLVVLDSLRNLPHPNAVGSLDCGDWWIWTKLLG